MQLAVNTILSYVLFLFETSFFSTENPQWSKKVPQNLYSLKAERLGCLGRYATAFLRKWSFSYKRFQRLNSLICLVLEKPISSIHVSTSLSHKKLKRKKTVCKRFTLMVKPRNGLEGTLLAQRPENTGTSGIFHG